MRLDLLKQGLPAKVRSLDGADRLLEAKLREVGFAEDDEIEVVHIGPLGGRPICVRLNRTLVALRAEEAAAIEVDVVS
ncbi:MAG: ferrous iron transport protein A [Parvularculaceae bacterium]